MKVTIITATYNSAATVADTLQSVQVQTYGDIEHLVIDGCSKDDTLSIVDKFDHVSKVVSEADKGIYDAMNKGISLANGEIIGILNSDDFYADANVIADVVKQFESTGCDALYADLIYIDPVKKDRVIRKWVSGGYSKNSFLKGWMPPHPTFFVKKEVYEKLGVFDLRLKSAADYELLLRFLYKHELTAVYLPRVLVHMRSGGASNRNIKNRIRAHQEDYRAWSINGIKPRWYTIVLKPVRKVLQYL